MLDQGKTCSEDVYVSLIKLLCDCYHTIHTQDPTNKVVVVKVHHFHVM